MSLTRRDRARRMTLLCCHFLRNLAYYKTGMRKSRLVIDDSYWRTVNGNFLDICVLEWGKVFGDKGSKHYWGKIITDHATFYAGVLDVLSLTESEFSDYVIEIKTYRDKFVAHLDSDLEMLIPSMRTARRCISYLYDYLIKYEDGGNYFSNLPGNASSYYKQCVREGRSHRP